MTEYEPIIGLEIHVQQSTLSKMFCGCSANIFGLPANTSICPVCLGLPGALPAVNGRAVKQCLKLGVALGCNVRLTSDFDRKSYFYPDLPKGFQISQYNDPFCDHGSVVIGSLTIRITRIHQEEDTARIIHQNDETLIDFNRSGMPLIEIVTEPDFRTAEEAKIFLRFTQATIRSLEISDADMEKGTMRLEANVSLRKRGEKKLPNYKVELKNINSFRFIEKAIEYEIIRQKEILVSGERPKQETRGWDEKRSVTFLQRSKEETQDYRYFPEPDIPPILLDAKEIEAIKQTLPELPTVFYNRLIRTGIQHSAAVQIALSQKLRDYFEQVELEITDKVELAEAAKWLTEEMSQLRLADQAVVVSARDLVQLIKLITAKKLTQTSAKLVFEKMVKSGQPPDAVMAESKIGVMSQAKLEDMVNSVILENPSAVSDYQAGKEVALSFLTGQIMKKSQGQADASVARRLIQKLIAKT